jgi:hypothetical protein
MCVQTLRGQHRVALTVAAEFRGAVASSSMLSSSPAPGSALMFLIGRLISGACHSKPPQKRSSLSLCPSERQRCSWGRDNVAKSNERQALQIGLVERSRGYVGRVHRRGGRAWRRHWLVI